MMVKQKETGLQARLAEWLDEHPARDPADAKIAELLADLVAQTKAGALDWRRDTILQNCGAEITPSKRMVLFYGPGSFSREVVGCPEDFPVACVITHRAGKIDFCFLDVEPAALVPLMQAVAEDSGDAGFYTPFHERLIAELSR